jgi:hypothetical protein
MAILAVGIAAITIPSALLIEPPPSLAPSKAAAAPAREDAAPARSPARDLLCSARFWVYVTGLLLALLPGWGFKLLVTSILHAHLGASVEIGTAITIIGLLLYSATRLAAGILNDHVSPRGVFVFALVVKSSWSGWLHPC